MFAGWVIENQGSGPAINVKWAQIQSGKAANFIPSIAAGMRTMLDNEFNDAIGHHAEVQIDYESLAGLKYRTVITWEGEVMHTAFNRWPAQNPSTGECQNITKLAPW